MEYNPPIRFHPFSPANPAIIGFYLCVRFTETAKINIFHNDLRRLIHQPDIRPVLYQPRIIMPERVFVKVDMILIRPQRGIKPRMGINMYRHYIFYGDIGWQEGVQASPPAP